MKCRCGAAIDEDGVCNRCGKLPDDCECKTCVHCDRVFEEVCQGCSCCDDHCTCEQEEWEGLLDEDLDEKE
jgi:hypothetical protein